MQTIRELLSRIRWDRDFGRARFELGYWDRVEARVVKVKFTAVETDLADGLFETINEEGRTCSIPLHRVRCVWRDGELIWSRKCSDVGAT